MDTELEENTDNEEYKMQERMKKTNGKDKKNGN